MESYICSSAWARKYDKECLLQCFSRLFLKNVNRAEENRADETGLSMTSIRTFYQNKKRIQIYWSYTGLRFRLDHCNKKAFEYEKSEDEDEITLYKFTTSITGPVETRLQETGD